MDSLTLTMKRSPKEIKSQTSTFIGSTYRKETEGITPTMKGSLIEMDNLALTMKGSELETDDPSSQVTGYQIEIRLPNRLTIKPSPIEIDDLASTIEDDVDSYMSYSSDEEIQCSTYTEDEMSSDSDNSVLQERKILHLTGSPQLDEVGNIDRKINDFISESNDKSVFFPPEMKKYLQDEHEDVLEVLQSTLKKGFFYLSKSLVVTMDIDNRRIKLPKGVVCDIFAVVAGEPVFILTFIGENIARRWKSLADKKKCSIYNSLVAKQVTSILRKRATYNVTIAKDVQAVKTVSNLKETLQEAKKAAAMFAIPGSLSLNAERLRSAVETFVYRIVVGQVESRDNHRFSGHQFDVLIRILEGRQCVRASTESNLTAVVMEAACRLSRERPTLIQIPESVDFNLLQLFRNYPNARIRTCCKCVAPDKVLLTFGNQDDRDVEPISEKCMVCGNDDGNASDQFFKTGKQRTTLRSLRKRKSRNTSRDDVKKRRRAPVQLLSDM